MIPITLRTPRLHLDTPTVADIDAITEYCRDPLFERYMVTPWPYEREHAEFFVERLVPQGWQTDAEYTWALRESVGGPLLGVIGWRRENSDIGYWIGAPHRGSGFVAEAVRAITAWLVDSAGVELVRWWTVVGNVASARVGSAAGYTFLGEGPSIGPDRSARIVTAWLAEFRSGDDAEPKAGWPTSSDEPRR